MIEMFARSAPLRIGAVVVLAVVVQLITHASWLAVVLPASYFVAKEIAAFVQPASVIAVSLATEPRLRTAAFVCDNTAFLGALLGFFVLQNAQVDASAWGRFAAFEGVVIVFVAAWAFVGAVALRRSSRAV